MAKIVLQKIIWQSMPKLDKEGKVITRKINGADTRDPDIDRIELLVDAVVPKMVPAAVQEEWLAQGWVRDDPNVEAPDRVEGPPSMLLPRAQLVQA